MPTPPRSMREAHAHRTFLACAAAAAFVALVLGLPPLLFGAFWVGVDLSRCELTVTCLLQRHLAEGLSLWLTPYAGEGAPLFSMPEASVAYPLRWVTLLFSPDAAASFFVVEHSALAAAGTCFLARSFRVPAGTACATGIVFALSGTALNATVHAMYLAGLAWLPWMWASARRALNALPSQLTMPLTLIALSFCMVLLAMEPQSCAIAAGIVAVETAVWLARAPDAPARVARVRRVALLVAATVGGALVGLVPWWSALAELALSARTGALSATDAFPWSFEPETWLGVLWSGVVIEPIEGGSLWSVLHDDERTFPWDPAPYLGLLFLACFAVGARCRRARGPLVVTLVFLVLALGHVTPLLPLAAKVIPLLRVFRFPAKYLVPMTLAATVVTGIGLRPLARSAPHRRFFVLCACIVCTANAAAAAFVWSLRAEWSTVSADVVAMLLRAMGIAAAPLTLALVAMAIPKRRALIGALLVVDMMAAATSSLNAGKPLIPLSSMAELVPPPPQTSGGLVDGRPPVVCFSGAVSAVGVGGDVLPALWWQVMFWRRWLMNDYQACDGLSSSAAYTVLRTRLQDALVFGHPSMSRALGCSVFAGLGTQASPGYTPITGIDEHEAMRPTLFAIEDPLPVAFIARVPRRIDDERRLVAAIEATEDAASVERLVDDPLKRLSAATPLPLGETATLTHLDWPTPDRATLHVAGTGGAVVALRAAFLVGWHGRQAGRELPTMRSTGQHLAVVVDDVTAGPVELTYEVPRVGVSVASGIGGLVLVLAALVLTRRRQPRRAAR